MRYQVRQKIIDLGLLRKLIEGSNSFIQGAMPVRRHDTAAPVALHNVPDVVEGISKPCVVLHLHHPNTPKVRWVLNI